MNPWLLYHNPSLCAPSRYHSSLVLNLVKNLSIVLDPYGKPSLPAIDHAKTLTLSNQAGPFRRSCLVGGNSFYILPQRYLHDPSVIHSGV